MDEFTKETYERFADKYESLKSTHLEYFLLKEADIFLAHLNGKKILDLGSGPGRDSLHFKQKGFYPVCIDLSAKMIELCKAKGLEAYQGDMENLEFNEEFEGVWACTSLLHLPKTSFSPMIKKLASFLKEGGILYLGMGEGNFEGFKESLNYPGCKRFFSFYTKEEIEKELTPYFEMFYFSRSTPEPGKNFLNFLGKKKIK